MSHEHISRALTTLIALSVVLVVAAMSCGSPRYNAVPKGDLHRVMWRIQASVDKLDRLMKQPQPKKPEVVAVLAKIEIAAKQLTTTKIQSKHPLLKDNGRGFLRSASDALKGAAADPPNYYPAGKLSGACIHCHDPDGGLRVD